MKEIELTQGKVAFVDDEDYPELSKYKWYALKRGNTYYAVRSIKVDGNKKKISIHRTILGNECDGYSVDHIDGDGLNNQRTNLRPCTHPDNLHNARKYVNNTSGFKGVTWNRRAGKWAAQIRINTKLFGLGYFDCPEEAAQAYDVRAKEAFGDFARLNFPA